MDKDEIILGISLLALIISSILLGILLANILKVSKNYTENNNCSDLNLEETANCLVDKVTEFYIYNTSNTGRKLNLTQLKIEGGTCRHWANYYISNFKDLGFMGKEIDFFSENKKDGHAIALVWDKELTNYCIIDQKNIIGCGGLG
jgi:hypothetical protein